MRATAIEFILMGAAALATSCGEVSAAGPADVVAKPFRVTSSAFVDGGMIPSRYTADGRNVSPPLSWTGAPPATVGYALIMDDPVTSAGTWIHWVLWNQTATQLDEDVRPSRELPSGASQGLNSWRRIGYGGPALTAQSGVHRFAFRVFALDARLDLPADAGADDLRRAMRGHTLAQCELSGRYESKK